jgi:hypothetical protein
MPHIVIDGSSPWKGRYEFDLTETEQPLTYREWGWIKKLSGYLPTTYWDGLEGVDAELVATLAVLALCRHGKIDKREVPDVFERIIDLPFTAISVEFDQPAQEDGDAGPPPSDAKPVSNGSTSGPGSPTSSGDSTGPPAPSGTPASASSESRQATTPSVT